MTKLIGIPAAAVVVLFMVFMKESHSALFDDPPHPQLPIHEEPFQGGVVPNVQNGLERVVLDDSSGSRRNDRFFGGYPGFGYNSYYNDYSGGGYASYRRPFLDYNGLVRNFERDCADTYPNRRYSCYGYGYGRK